MLFLLVFFTLIASFLLTVFPLPVALIVCNMVTQKSDYTVSYFSLAKRSFLVAWILNFLIYFMLGSKDVSFNGITALASPWTMFICCTTVAIVVYINYQTLKVPYEEE